MPPPRENKPSWSDVPPELVTAIENLIGDRISHATTVWGGYGPSATFSLHTQRGRSYFCKGTHPGHTPIGAAATLREQKIYAEIPEIHPFAPAFHGAANHGPWHMLLLDHIDQSIRIPPWTADSFDRVIALLARFHNSMPPRIRPILEALDTPVFNLGESPGPWHALSRNPSRRQNFLSLFADPAAAQNWLDDHLSSFITLETAGSRIGGPQSWIHQDLRSDNILFNPRGCPLLVDWPNLAYGPVLLDIAGFFPSVAGEGGPSPAAALERYERECGHRFNERDIQIAAAAIAGYFAARAGEPDLPELPRLRWVQRLQLFPSLNWLTQVTAIPPAPPPK